MHVCLPACLSYLSVCHAAWWFNIWNVLYNTVQRARSSLETHTHKKSSKRNIFSKPIMGIKSGYTEGKERLKMRYTTMDVGNIFKSLFRIYKTTKLLMQHHKSLHKHTQTKMKLQNQQYALTFLQVTLHKHTTFFGANSWKGWVKTNKMQVSVQLLYNQI